MSESDGQRREMPLPDWLDRQADWVRDKALDLSVFVMRGDEQDPRLPEKISSLTGLAQFLRYDAARLRRGA